MKTKFKSLALSAFLMALVVFQSSCSRPDEPAPELPPESSMVMNFNDFDESSGKVMDSTSNFGYSAVNVGVWNVVIFVNLAIPVASFQHSFTHQAKWRGAIKRWVWEYDYTLLGVKFQASLQGWIESGQVNWEMYITRKGKYNKFLWYSGVSEIDRTGGEWTLYRDPENPEPYVSAVWTDDQGGNRDITYTNIVPGDPANGGYIKYGETTDLTYDRFYTIYGAENQVLIEIEWNSVTGEGHVRNPDHFGDTDWHCWDGMHIDTTC